MTRAPSLLGALLRAAPKRPAGSAAAVALAAVIGAAAAGGAPRMALALQLAAVALAAGVAPLIVAEVPVAEAAPIPRGQRRLLLVAIAVPVLALVWAVLLRLADAPGMAVTAQLAAVVALAVGGTAWLGEAAVIGVALGFGGARLLAPERLFAAAPGAAALVAWLALAALGVAALAAASRDPAR